MQEWEDPDPCEWNPRKNAPALSLDDWHASAALVVGVNGQWRLCRKCAVLPRFRSYRVRREITAGRE